MPARHLAALIQRLHPETSVRQLETAAGLAENKIAYWLKPSTIVSRMPTAPTINELARALDCDPVVIVQAFAADVDLPWNETLLTDDDRDLLRLVHRLNARERRALRLVLMALLTAHEAEAEAESTDPPPP